MHKDYSNTGSVIPVDIVNLKPANAIENSMFDNPNLEKDIFLSSNFSFYFVNNVFTKSFYFFKESFMFNIDYLQNCIMNSYPREIL